MRSNHDWMKNMKFKLFLSVAVIFLVTADLRSADDGSGLFSSLWGAMWAKESREQPISATAAHPRQQAMAALAAGESGDDVFGINDDEQRKQVRKSVQVARKEVARQRKAKDRQREAVLEYTSRQREVALEYATRQREIATRQREVALEYAAQQREIATRQREYAARQREIAVEQAARRRHEVAVEQVGRRVAGRRMPMAVESRQEQQNEESLQLMLALSLSQPQRARIEDQEDEELKRVIALSKVVGDNEYVDVDKVLDNMYEAREQEELNKVRKRMGQAAAEDKEVAESQLLVRQKRVALPRQLLQQKQSPRLESSVPEFSPSRPLFLNKEGVPGLVSHGELPGYFAHVDDFLPQEDQAGPPSYEDACSQLGLPDSSFIAKRY